MPWTQEMLETAVQLARDGLSAGQIAVEIGNGVSRNAVIGKLHRAKHRLSDLNGRVRQAKSPTEKIAARVKTERRVKIKEASAPIKRMSRELAHLAVERKDGVELVDLECHHCRWPHGDGRDVWYCGRQRDGEASYCEGHRLHAGRAYEDAKARG